MQSSGVRHPGLCYASLALRAGGDVPQRIRAAVSVPSRSGEDLIWELVHACPGGLDVPQSGVQGQDRYTPALVGADRVGGAHFLVLW